MGGGASGGGASGGASGGSSGPSGPGADGGEAASRMDNPENGSGETKEEKKKKLKDKKKKKGPADQDEEDEKKAKDWEKDDSYHFTAEQLVKGIRNQLRKGNYRPSGFEDKEGIGEKGAKKLIRKGVFVAAAPLAPVLIVPYTVGNFVHTHAGADHSTLWIICIQLIIQRLVLAASGITIEPYYEDLTSEYNEKQKAGDCGHFEHSAWEKAQEKKEKDKDIPFTKLKKDYVTAS